MKSLRDDKILFSNGELSHAMSVKEHKVRKDVARHDTELFLSTPEADLVDHFVTKHAVARVELKRDEITMESVETEIEVRRLPNAFHYVRLPIIDPGDRGLKSRTT